MSELATRVDVSTGSVGNWENAPPEKPMIPEAKTLAKLAATLEVSAVYLLHGAPQKEGRLNEAAHWRDRALKAERELGEIRDVLLTAAARLTEAAAASPQGAEETGKQKRRRVSSTLPSGVKETVEKVAERLSREDRKS